VGQTRVVGQTRRLEVEKPMKGLTAHRKQLPNSQQTNVGLKR
jgi:hypothetical protein